METYNSLHQEGLEFNSEYTILPQVYRRLPQFSDMNSRVNHHYTAISLGDIQVVQYCCSSSSMIDSSAPYSGDPRLDSMSEEPLSPLRFL
jgi:hypothetical protein